MAISDAQFRFGVAIGGAALVIALTGARFCGGVTLPDRPALATRIAHGSTSELLASSAQTQNVYRELLAKDAIAAGTRAPTIEDMSKKLVYRGDETRHVLEVGQPAIELAGVKLRALHSGESLALEIVNATTAELGYHVVTEVVPSANCMAVRPLPLDVLVIGSEPLLRTECGWHDGMSLVVEKVETVELSPLGAYLVRQTPPSLLAIEPVIARGSKTGSGNKECGTIQSRSMKAELDRGEIGWRDLVDFYSRHRCQTYQIPPDYRAFTTDGQRALPATAAGN